MKKIYFVRHGETEGNAGKFFQFHDTLLTAKGHADAIKTGERLSHLKVDVILASPFTRAQQTAEHIHEMIGVPIETVKALHEQMQSFLIRGKLWDSPEGVLYHNARKNNYFAAEWPDRDGAENHADALVRIAAAVTLLENHPSDNIVVVSHGQFLNQLFIYLLLGKNTTSEFHQVIYENQHHLANGAITEFTFDDNQWKLFTYNDHAHFAE